MPLEDLPHVDEHSVVVEAPPEAVWRAAVKVLHGTFGTGPTPTVARLLGCEPSSTSGWDRPGVGSTVPGFRIVEAQSPRLLVVAGRHRFSRYGIVIRIEPHGRDSRLRLETRATFPGAHGAAYRLAVLGTRLHVLVTRRMLGRIARAAERAVADHKPADGG